MATEAQVEPLGDRVLVKVIERVRVTPGGVLLPENMRQESDRGVVLAVGPGTDVMEPMFMAGGGGFGHEFGGGPYGGSSAGAPLWKPGKRPVPVEVGEVIVFSPYAGSSVSVGSEDYLLVREHDILGRLRGAEVIEVEGEYRIRQDEVVVELELS